ncbi:rhodanese-like domain-containing protein [Acinetobacter apis]|uniref:Rhodanese-related sulfurtransferase n=1 Tax=Acinetobacter apis TaxID=1229165 RepID=A0A217EIM6_9GAMM|nr:rhodanese-like domain-containing protein [Acinetobacter apis]SNQ30130.1 Rhodanese-related sulfurtransferase [Acinetobacter apis]
MIRKQEITTFDFPNEAIIWDVRDENAYAESHLKAAVNQPIDTLTKDSLANVAADQPIYILCGGGSKAPRAAEILDHLDSSREYVVLMGGMRAVKAAGIETQS